MYPDRGWVIIDCAQRSLGKTSVKCPNLVPEDVTDELLG